MIVCMKKKKQRSLKSDEYSVHIFSLWNRTVHLNTNFTEKSEMIKDEKHFK